MTKTELLQDEILGLEAKLAGKRLELAMAQHKRVDARKHLIAMQDAVRARRDLRIALGARDGGCYFDVTGRVDRESGVPV